jgi:hypothetical protein
MTVMSWQQIAPGRKEVRKVIVGTVTTLNDKKGPHR